MPAKSAKKAPTRAKEAEHVKQVWTKFKEFATSVIKKAGNVSVPQKDKNESMKWVKKHANAGEEDVVACELKLNFGKTEKGQDWYPGYSDELPWEFISFDGSGSIQAMMRYMNNRLRFYKLLTESKPSVNIDGLYTYKIETAKLLKILFVHGEDKLEFSVKVKPNNGDVPTASANRLEDMANAELNSLLSSLKGKKMHTPKEASERGTRKGEGVRDVWTTFVDFAMSFIKKAGCVYVPDKQAWFKYAEEVGEERVMQTALSIKLGKRHTSRAWKKDLAKLPWKFLTDGRSDTFVVDTKERTALYNLLTQSTKGGTAFDGESLHVNIKNDDDGLLHISFRIHSRDSNDELVFYVVLIKTYEGTVFSSMDIDRIVTLARAEVKHLRESLHSRIDEVPVSMFVPAVGSHESIRRTNLAGFQRAQTDDVVHDQRETFPSSNFQAVQGHYPTAPVPMYDYPMRMYDPVPFVPRTEPKFGCSVQ